MANESEGLFEMDTHALIREIDTEVAKLRHARRALVAISSASSPTKGRRRTPKGANTPPASTRKPLRLSPETMAEIAAAQKNIPIWRRDPPTK